MAFFFRKIPSDFRVAANNGIGSTLGRGPVGSDQSRVHQLNEGGVGLITAVACFGDEVLDTGRSKLIQSSKKPSFLPG